MLSSTTRSLPQPVPTRERFALGSSWPPIRRSVAEEVRTRTLPLPMASLALASPSGDLAVGDAAIVVIDNFTFDPSKLSIQTGIAVTWVNHDAG